MLEIFIDSIVTELSTQNRWMTDHLCLCGRYDASKIHSVSANGKIQYITAGYEVCAAEIPEEGFTVNIV